MLIGGKAKPPKKSNVGFFAMVTFVSDNYIAEPSTEGTSGQVLTTDYELINKTGGIVQGMSGSPIIQNNKIIGAVTHVVVSNPMEGYGVFIRTMLEEGEK